MRRCGVISRSVVLGGPEDEFLDVAVEGPDPIRSKVEVRCTVEARVRSGLTGSDRSRRDLDAVHEVCGLR